MKNKKSFFNNIFEIYDDTNHITIKFLGIKFHKKRFVSNSDFFYLKQDLESKIEKTLPSTKLKLEIDIVDHCNLNCRGCDHFSPIAKEKFLDIESFKKDIERLSYLTEKGYYLEKFSLLGGEPLLHPEICKLLKITRKALPFANNISIITNAILLPSMGQDFWDTCKENSITIFITKYPIKIDYKKIEEIAANNSVKIDYFNNKEVMKTSYKLPLDPEGKQDARNNFLNCHHANFCIPLKAGRIYTCTVAPSIQHFNEYYNYNLPLTEYDSIDIYKAKSLQEILTFVSRQIPFCSYCKVKERSYGNEWGISKKEIGEWM